MSILDDLKALTGVSSNTVDLGYTPPSLTSQAATGLNMGQYIPESFGSLGQLSPSGYSTGGISNSISQYGLDGSTAGYLPKSLQLKSFTGSDALSKDSLNLSGTNAPAGGLSGALAVIGAATSIADLVGKFGALDVSKSNLKFQKEAFGKNYEASRKTANNRITDRYAERVNSYGKERTDKNYGSLEDRLIK